MSRRIFGWDLPPGVTQRMIDDQCAEGPCNICGQDPDRCICPECPACGAVGDPFCYVAHGLVRSPGQTALKAEAEQCPACGNDGWLICQRSDGYAAVECCDECQRFMQDEDAAAAASSAGVLCDLSYPCYVLALPPGWGRPSIGEPT